MNANFATLQDIQDAFQADDVDPHTVMRRSQAFFKAAAGKNDLKALEFLMEVARRRIESYSDSSASFLAIQWLGGYKAAKLVPFFVSLLEDRIRRREAIRALGKLEDSSAIEPLLSILPEIEDEPYVLSSAIQTLTALRSVEAIEIFVTYLYHPILEVRMAAILGVIILGKAAGRIEVVSWIGPLLEDASPAIRELVASSLTEYFPGQV